jgi:hypothetical protein
LQINQQTIAAKVTARKAVLTGGLRFGALYSRVGIEAFDRLARRHAVIGRQKG